jgi:hypothetical protein
MDNHKECFKCGNSQPLSEFYKHAQMADGHLNKCKTCAKKDVASNIEKRKEDPEWVFNERERGRLKAARELREGKRGPGSGRKKSPKRWIDQELKVEAARVARRDVSCPKGKSRHHWSYNQEHWSDVILLNLKDHAKIHRYTVYDSEHKQYRTVHGVLLDSRELAEAYYKKVLSIKDGVYSELKKLF